MNRSDQLREAIRLSSKIDEGVTALVAAGRAEAEAEHTYRLNKAKAWVENPEGTAAERAAIVDGVTAGLRRDRDLAAAARQAALEALRSRRQQLSAVQTLVAADKVEAEHARFGVEVSP